MTPAKFKHKFKKKKSFFETLNYSLVRAVITAKRRVL